MQLSLDPAQEMTDLAVSMHRGRDDLSGTLGYVVTNEHGKVLLSEVLSWRKPRDLSGLRDVVRDITNAYLWGSTADVQLVARTALKEHCPELDVVAESIHRAHKVTGRRRVPGQAGYRTV